MKPEDFFGNEIALKVCQKLVERGSPPNTLLFTGPSGVGKALLAYFMVKALCCERRKAGQNSLYFCDKCKRCTSIEMGEQSEFVAIRPKTTKLTVKQIREDYDSLRAAYLHPHSLPYRIFLLEECHIITDELANSMLKLLEEPSTKTIFILITDKPYLLLPTITSRSFGIRFFSEPAEKVEQYLREFSEKNSLRRTESAVKLASYFSQGRVGLAKTLLLKPDVLSELAGVLSAITSSFNKRQKPATSYLLCFRERLMEVSGNIFRLLLQVEEEEDLPKWYYLPPWKRRRKQPGDEDEVEHTTSARKNEIERFALRFVLESLNLTLYKTEDRAETSYPGKYQQLFAKVQSMLDVNIRTEQVLDYLLIGLSESKTVTVFFDER